MSARRAFINSEARAFLDFYYREAVSDRELVYVSREYRCDCGHRTPSAAEIYDHAEVCRRDSRVAERVQGGGVPVPVVELPPKQGRVPTLAQLEADPGFTQTDEYAERCRQWEELDYRGKS